MGYLSIKINTMKSFKSLSERLFRAFLLLAFSSLLFSQNLYADQTHAHAKELFLHQVKKDGGKWTSDSAIDYVDTLKFMERFEYAEDPHLKPKKSDTGLFWFLILESAYANQPQQCLLAGRIGNLQGNTCKPSDATFNADLATCRAQHYSVPCSREIFPGDPLTCANSTGSRWTAACASRFFGAAGLQGKTLDSDFNADDLRTLSTYLNRKNVNPQELATKTENLCTAIRSSNKTSDIHDCQELYSHLRGTRVTQTTEAEVQNVVAQIGTVNHLITAPGCAACDAAASPLPLCDLEKLSDSCNKVKSDITYSDGSKTGGTDTPPPAALTPLKAQFRTTFDKLKTKEPGLYQYLNSRAGRMMLEAFKRPSLTPSEAATLTSIEIPVEENGVTTSRRLTYQEAFNRINTSMGEAYIAEFRSAWEAVHTEQLSENNVLIAQLNQQPARLTQLNDTFRFAQRTIAEKIRTKHTPPTDWEKAELAIINNIHYISPTTSQEELARTPDIANNYAHWCLGYPDAFYSRPSNSFIICPNYAFQPLESLALTCGHEMTHSIDSPLSVCQSLHAQHLKVSPEFDRQCSQLLQCRGDSACVSQLTGFVQNYTFYNEMNCLMTDPEAAFSSGSSMNRDEYKNYLMNEYLSRTVSPSAADIEQTRITIAQNVDRLSETDFANRIRSQRSQEPEVLADFVGSSVANAYLTGRSPGAGNNENLRPLSSRLHSYCTSSTATTAANPNRLFNQLSYETQDEHPSDRKRAELLLLSQPEVARFVGCRPKRPNMCQQN